MNEATKQALLSFFRSVLISVGGVAVTKGYISADVLNQVVGAVIVLAAAGWGVLDKLRG